jgi:hypothetical protein
MNNIFLILVAGGVLIKWELLMSKYFSQSFRMIVGLITISAILGSPNIAWCQNQPGKEASIPLKKQQARDKMKTLKIQWQRLVIDDQTCQRCGATETEVDKAVQSLKQSLNPLGIEVRLEKRAITQAEFEKNPSKSNLIVIGDRSLEEWLQARTGQSSCCGPCGDAECRTIETQGKIYETIPAELITKAGLIAAGKLFNPKAGQTCCP